MKQRRLGKGPQPRDYLAFPALGTWETLGLLPPPALPAAGFILPQPRPPVAREPGASAQPSGSGAHHCLPTLSAPARRWSEHPQARGPQTSPVPLAPAAALGGPKGLLRAVCGYVAYDDER